MKPPQKLEHMEDQIGQGHEHLQAPEVSAEFVEAVRAFLLSTNKYVSQEQMEDLF
jgi:hypothetical protein